MDENTSPVSTPGSENSSIRERFSPLQTKTNKSRYEIKSDGGKKTSTTPTPARSPLTEKNASIVTPPYFNRQTFDKLYRRSPPPAEKQRQQKFQLHTDKKDNDDDCSVRELKQLQQRQQQHQPTSPPLVQSSPKLDGDKLQQRQSTPSHTEDSYIEADTTHSHLLDNETKAQQQEIGELKATLEAERRYSAWMMTWEITMVNLVNQFKEIQTDVDDSVDILVESDQVLADMGVEAEKQAQVDELMNLVPQRLFEIEELKSKLSAAQ